MNGDIEKESSAVRVFAETGQALETVVDSKRLHIISGW